MAAFWAKDYSGAPFQLFGPAHLAALALILLLNLAFIVLRRSPSQVWRVAIGSNIYLAAVFVINLLLKSNYMFIAHKPETASLMDVLGPWPWYILALEGIGLVMVLILYFPFHLRDRKRA